MTNEECVFDHGCCSQGVCPGCGHWIGPIPETWTFVTAGDGRHFCKESDGDWYGIGNPEVLTDDELRALGRLRRAVVVTLPDAVEVSAEIPFWASGWTFWPDLPARAMKRAGVLIAAALRKDGHG